MSEESLSEFDFTLFLDASGSMGETDMPNGKSRWESMQESVTAFARDVEKYDTDGLTVVVFGGSSLELHANVTSAKVKDVFAARSPRGSTPLAEALQLGLKEMGKSAKKDFALVFTDGVPDDKAAAAQVIVNASKDLENDQDLTFLFVQIGRDAAATAYLKGLDDNLRGAKFDIVDVKTMEEAEKFPTTSALVIAAIEEK